MEDDDKDFIVAEEKAKRNVWVLSIVSLVCFVSYENLGVHPWSRVSDWIIGLIGGSFLCYIIWGPVYLAVGNYYEKLRERNGHGALGAFLFPILGFMLILLVVSYARE